MKRLSFVGLVVCVVALAATSVPSADTIVVQPDNMNGWSYAIQTTSCDESPLGEFRLAGPGSPPAGTGAFHFLTEVLNPCGTDPYRIEKVYLGTNNHSGVALDDITSFKYWTYVRSRSFDGGGGDPDGQPPMIEIITDSGSNPFQQRIFIYRPWGWWGGHNIAKNTWQEWDLMATGDPRTWQMVFTGSTNCWGDWNWVKRRYPGNMRLSTPVVGDYVQGYTADYHLRNQTGTSLGIRVGSGSWQESKIWNPDTQQWKYPWSWWRESCGIDAYADKLVIGINGVEYVYDFEGGAAGTVAIRPGACRDPIIAGAKNKYFFVVFGRVMDDPAPTATQFFLDDGDKKIKVIAQNQVLPGEYWRAKGTLEWDSSAGRYDLYSSAYDLVWLR